MSFMKNPLLILNKLKDTKYFFLNVLLTLLSCLVKSYLFSFNPIYMLSHNSIYYHIIDTVLRNRFITNYRRKSILSTVYTNIVIPVCIVLIYYNAGFL